jgi:hypothetical protein
MAIIDISMPLRHAIFSPAGWLIYYGFAIGWRRRHYYAITFRHYAIDAADAIQPLSQ